MDPRWTAGGVASTCVAGKPSSQRARGITDTYKEQLGADLFALTRAARREPMNPDTIVLIHGFWVTSRSWEHWKAHYEQQGYRVVTGSPTSAGREDRSIDTRPVTANGTSAEPT